MFSCAVGREGHCKYRWRVWECSQWMGGTGFATAQGGLYFPGPHCSCPGSSARALFHVDPVFHALPSSKPLRVSGALQGHRPGWAVHFVSFPGLSSSSNWLLGERTVPCELCLLNTPWSWLLNFLGTPESTILGVLVVTSGELISG